MLVDTHCHIHQSDYPLNADEVIARAKESGVNKMLCIGTKVDDSQRAVNFATDRDGLFSVVGVHPHFAKNGIDGLEELLHGSSRNLATSARVARGEAAPPEPNEVSEGGADRATGPEQAKGLDRKVVAIGEIGLDYHYDFSPREDQIQIFEAQINLALFHDLPIVFHVREAYEDFWQIINNYPSIRGELHSFTDKPENLKKALDKGFYIGVNGYSTFIKGDDQREMFASIPLDRLLLETDAPYLTPVPFRGTINEPMFVRNIAEYHAKIRRISLQEIADQTTANVCELFGI